MLQIALRHNKVMGLAPTDEVDGEQGLVRIDVNDLRE